MKKEKIAFITGASDGVGKAIAMNFAKVDLVFICYQDQNKNSKNLKQKFLKNILIIVLN